jgi:hypothetical protein
MLNCLKIIVRTLFWHHNRRAALPAEALAFAVVLAKGCPLTDNEFTRLLIRHLLPAAEPSSELENATNQLSESRI